MIAEKFTFDTVFAGTEDVATDTARARQRHTMTTNEVEAIKAEAYAQGKVDGEVRAQEAIAAGASEAAGALREALARTAEDIAGVRAQATNIAFAAARKMAHAALTAMPAADVEQALRDAMHQAIGEPRITLRASPAVIDALQQKTNEIAEEEGFEGRVMLAADPALEQADCRVEWRGAGAERTGASLEAAIETLLARHFSDTAPIALTPTPQTED